MQKSLQLRTALALVAVAVLACVSVLLATSAVVQGQSSPPATPTLAAPTCASQASRYNIHLVDAHGANLRHVVDNASAPALTGDGRLLAYRHWRTDDRGIVVVNSDGSNALRVTDKREDTLPSFAPDSIRRGRRRAFATPGWQPRKCAEGTGAPARNAFRAFGLWAAGRFVTASVGGAADATVGAGARRQGAAAGGAASARSCHASAENGRSSNRVSGRNSVARVPPPSA